MIFNENNDATTRMVGVYVGEVTDNSDPEDMGRVKVEFPWRDANDTSHWARMATLMAGSDMGTYFLPKTGDEVLVSFANGDQRFPYVIGALWNTDQKPPQQNTGDNDVRMIRSRSGHEILLNDGSSGGKIELVSSTGHTVTLDDASGSETISIEDKSGLNSVEFDATTGTLSIEAGTKLELSATNVDISGDGQINIKSSGILKLEGAVIQLN